MTQATKSSCRLTRQRSNYIERKKESNDEKTNRFRTEHHVGCVPGSFARGDASDGAGSAQGDARLRTVPENEPRNSRGGQKRCTAGGVEGRRAGNRVS